MCSSDYKWNQPVPEINPDAMAVSGFLQTQLQWVVMEILFPIHTNWVGGLENNESPFESHDLTSIDGFDFVTGFWVWWQRSKVKGWK